MIVSYVVFVKKKKEGPIYVIYGVPYGRCSVSFRLGDVYTLFHSIFSAPGICVINEYIRGGVGVRAGRQKAFFKVETRFKWRNVPKK